MLLLLFLVNEKCVVNNGLCSMFCLLILFGWMCVCEEGVFLEKDGRMELVNKMYYIDYYLWYIFCLLKIIVMVNIKKEINYRVLNGGIY